MRKPWEREDAFAKAQQDLVSYAIERNWKLRGTVKTRYLTSPGNRIRLWLRPTQVLVSLGESHNLSDATPVDILKIRPDLDFLGPGRYSQFIEELGRVSRYEKSLLDGVAELLGLK